MFDFAKSKSLKIPEGNVVKITFGDTVLWKRKYTNQILASIDKEGNTVGLVDGYRYNSSDVLVAQAGCCATGFIAIKPGDTIRFKGIQFRNATISGVTSGAYYIRIYNSNFTELTAMSAYNMPNTENFFSSSHILDSDGDLKEFVLKSNTSYAYMRMAFVREDGVEPVITVNEAIQ